MKIGIDVMGGDFAPLEAIKGIAAFLMESKEKGDDCPSIVLFGIKAAIDPLLNLLAGFEDAYEVVPCGSEISMHEHPIKAIKEKSDSSIAMGFGYLAKGKIDAFISAGNTGAMMVGSLYSVKSVPGVLRPTIASPLPKLNGRYNFILDAGANADCKPEHLVQFALMGSLYSRHILNLENPRVALLNIGEEKEKGNLLSQATYPLLEQLPGINFVGNREGRDVLLDNADVFVCEGFVGNVVLKMAESIYAIFKEKKQLEDPFLDQFNFQLYGGTPILGVNAPVIIGHGISQSWAFVNMIKTAEKFVSSRLVSIIQDLFKN